MRTQLNINLPKLKNADDFESLLRDICALEWNDPTTEKFGRKGQKQFGVDVYGRPDTIPNIYRGVQCKHRMTDKQLSQEEIEKEVSDARLFPHKLDRLIIATDGARDSKTQVIIDKYCETELKEGRFQVNIWFWDDISERLAVYPHLIIKYYRELYKPLTTFPMLERLIEIPIQIAFDTLINSQRLTEVVNALEFRGVRVLSTNQANDMSAEIRGGWVDGIVCCAPIEGEGNNAESSLLPFLSKLTYYEKFSDAETPIFLLLSPKILEKFNETAYNLGLNIKRFSILLGDQDSFSIADHIFARVSSSGYRKRGYPNTFNILFRARDVRMNGILLDVNWQNLLSTEHFPTADEWETQIAPALRTIRKQIASWRDTTRIQINSQLPIPAAIAVGFYFNVRVAKLGVWARTTSSDLKRQFWLSDARVEHIMFNTEWMPCEYESGSCAVLEITSYVSIHKSVQAFIASQNFQVGKWGSTNIQIDGKTAENIEEEMAVSFANYVGQIVRQLNSQGFTDIHLFARIPSALAVLIGQRLYACGRIHLYWFDNPSYRYAFCLE